MLKYAKYAVPYLLRAPRRNPVKNLAGLFLAYLLCFLATVFIVIAAFIWMSKEFGLEVAFAATGVTFMFSAFCILIGLNTPKPVPAPTPPKIASDPLAKYIPESVKENPTMQKLLYQIGESPVTATATAVTVGMLLSRELIED